MFRIGTVIALMVLVLLQLASSYPQFPNNIPNGANVTSPCDSSKIWRGVGHENHLGGGARNPFGKAFATNGFTWTKALCEEDTDSDGRTNGEELGDPDCTWVVGAKPTYDTDISHPGICEPIDSEWCKSINTFDVCPKEFECEAFGEAGIVQHEVKLTESPVPAEVTTYMCQAIDLPADRDYHVVGMKPNLDNEIVIHHILVYACDDTADLTDLASPQQCFMTSRKGCSDIIAIWAVGSSGSCAHKDVGFRVGKTSSKRVVMELHWNNPEKIATYRDGSGLTLYLSTILRPFDAGMLMYGQNLLIIPPGRESHVINGTCPSQCTSEYMSESINIVGATNHMHYLGSGALSQVRRRNTGERIILSEDKQFSYNTPTFVTFDDPVVLHPGDELELMCKFNSKSRHRTTFEGDGTNDEMCYTFLTYYPKDTFKATTCVSTGPVGECQWEDPVIAGCEMKYLDVTNPEALAVFEQVDNLCIVGRCLEECKEYTKELLKNPCYHPDLKYIFQGNIRRWSDNPGDKLAAMEYWYKVDSCLAEIAKEAGCGINGNWTTAPPIIGGASRNAIVPLVTMVAVFITALV